MKVEWTTFKAFIDQRNLSIQYVDFGGQYWLKAFDGNFALECFLDKNPPSTTELDDFEDNYKDSGNKSPVSTVITQFEGKDKTLKLFSADASVSAINGTATILAQIPGEVGSGDGRWINSGLAFFSSAQAGDKITGVWFVDHDNILGLGVDYVVGSYTDDAADSNNRGWYIPSALGTVKAESIGFYGFAPSGFYIKITGKKATGFYTGKLFINLEWAKVE